MSVLEKASKFILTLMEEHSERGRVIPPPIIRKAPEKRRLVWQKYTPPKTWSLMPEKDFMEHIQNLIVWHGEPGTSPAGMKAINSIAALRIFWENARKLEIKNRERMW